MVPGAPSQSKLVTVLSTGKMPQGRPHMPAADLDRVRAWISAGAAEN